jgi:hypothetical protein
MSASDNDEDGAFTLGDLLKNKQS